MSNLCKNFLSIAYHQKPTVERILSMFHILDTNLWPSRSPVGAGSGGAGAGVGLPPDTKQPQLLLMRVSSVKSSRSSHDNESSNNNKRGTGGNQGSQQQHKGPFTNYVDILLL